MSWTGAVGPSARIIYEHIDPAEHICSLRNHLFALDAVGHITHPGFQAGSSVDGSLESIAIDVAGVDIVARSEEGRRDMLANPRSAGCDENLSRHSSFRFCEPE